MYVPFYDWLIFAGCTSPFFGENFKIRRDLGKRRKEAELAGDDSRQVDPHTLDCMQVHSVCIGRLVLARDWVPSGGLPTSLGPDVSRGGGV